MVINQFGGVKHHTRVMTVTITLIVTRTMVKRRYLPMSGITRLVEGIISTSRRKNTVSEMRMDMQRLIFSPPWNVDCICFAMSNSCRYQKPTSLGR